MAGAVAVPLAKDVLLGAWRMRSWTYEIVGTGERRDALGADPDGWIIYDPERVMVLALNHNRKNPVDRHEQIRFCKIEGDTLTYISAPAKNPLDGSEGVHTVKFEQGDLIDFRLGSNTAMAGSPSDDRSTTAAISGLRLWANRRNHRAASRSVWL
jgi:hypothetical protein